jgi:hypothetical protein
MVINTEFPGRLIADPEAIVAAGTVVIGHRLSRHQAAELPTTNRSRCQGGRP